MFAVFNPNAATIGPHPSEVTSQKPVKSSRRRDKPQMSCTACRQKKLRCDRLKPCSNCTKRGQSASCDYIRQDTPLAQQVRPQATTKFQDRIRHLEEMVVTLMNSQARLEQGVSSAERSSATTPSAPIQDVGFTHSPAPSLDNQRDSDVPESSLGKFTRAKSLVNFVGSGHWEAILEDIAELKIDLENTDESEMIDFKPQILFGINNHATRSEITSSVPPRPICDMLLSRWFTVMDMAPMIIHPPTFMEEYNQMWKDPGGTPLMWFGLLFSILGLASHLYLMSGDELHSMPEPFTSISDMVNHYRDRTAQCLIEVNYLKPVRYTVDTLCFYYVLEPLQARDSEFGAYVVLGIIVRVAMRLGYHRDASHYPSISPFEGEMRRRTWSIIFQLDLLTSVRVGLPRMIRDGETDTAEPRNLLDSDFDEYTTELPHPRPSTVVTPIAYAIFKTRILRHLGLVMDQVNAITPLPYEDVMRLDSQLMTTHTSLPPYLTMRSLSLSLADHASLIFRRYALEACFQKSRCMLHRKYLIPGKSSPHYRYSRTASVDAAMQLLDVQCTLHEASQPGGQLYRERWRMNTAVSQDYVLAAMILCLDLDWDVRFGKSQEDEVERTWPKETRIRKLQRSYEIWSESSRISAIAAKAAEVLRVMLQRIEAGISKAAQEEPVEPAGSMPELAMVPNPATVSDDTLALQFFTDHDPPRFDPSESFDSSIQSAAGPFTTDLLSDMIDTETNFDWGLWDSHFNAIPTIAMPNDPPDFGSFTFQ